MKFTTLAVSSLLLVACGDSSGEGGAGGTPGTTTSATSGSTKSVSASSGSSGNTTVATTAASTTANSSSSTGAQAEIEVNNAKNIADCVATQGISPVLPQEAGHFAASRLTPPSYPFEVTHIAYDLVKAAAPQCSDQSLEHAIELYVIDTAAPEATPVVVAEDNVAAGSADTHVVDLELDPPLTLMQGESLVIAVKLVGTANQSLCIGACGDDPAVSDVDYWSNAPMAPFAWADMIDDFGFTQNFTTRMFGTAQ